MIVHIEELMENKRRNFQQRLDFIDLYVEWIKKTPNDVWSAQQKKLIDA